MIMRRLPEVDADKYALYSPLSVVESMITGRIQNYWNKTETYEALAEYIASTKSAEWLPAFRAF